ncbi:MAG: hypothetical protein M0P97_04050, partial [Candidatus Moranbacteria bacterium]|nr:hypothetical protein [Candidatus Moranbacteria bacterium]
GINVSDGKASAPEVAVVFSPSNPTPGEKIIARALPSFFGNQKKSLYYTWYIKHDGCEIASRGSSGYKASCDVNGDNRVNEEDWKIEAMRIIAQDGFDNNINTQGDWDNDGYSAYFGGDKNLSPAYCYVHNFSNGNNYELIDNGANGDGTSFLIGTRLPNTLSTCPSGNVKCVKSYTETCTADGSISLTDDGVLDTDGTLSGLFSDYDACSDSEMDVYCNPSQCYSDPSNLGEEVCAVSCPLGTEPYCISSTWLDPSCEEIDGVDRACSTMGTPLTFCRTDQLASSSVTNGCEHLFPNADNDDTGNNSFGTAEENFWGTDPRDPDTSDRGQADEATVSGLGIDEFKWNYMNGDKVGVVVEGNSIVPTKHDNSSMMVMWALPKNKCTVQNVGSYVKIIKGYPVTIPTATMDINDCLEDNLIDPREGGQPTKLDVSLEYNPTSPNNDASGRGLGDLVSVQAVTSNSEKEVSQLYYKWDVRRLNTPNKEMSLDSDNWISISDITSFRDETDMSLIEGNNISDLDFSLNVEDNSANYGLIFNDDGVGYLRVYVDVEEVFDSGLTRVGHSDVIIRVTSSSEKIDLYSVQVDPDSLALSLGSEICSGEKTCYVANGQIIGARISSVDIDLSNYSWTLDGNMLDCTQEMSGSCQNTKQTNAIFFPISGNAGRTFSLNLVANDIEGGTREGSASIELARRFELVTPFVKIIPESGAEKKELGTYIDITGETPAADLINYSENFFVSTPGSNINLSGEFHPSFIVSDSIIKWFIDGVDQNNATDQIFFAANKPAGSVYNVSVEAEYVQPTDARRALQKFWGIRQENSTENIMNEAVQVEIGEGDPMANKGGVARILATLSSNVSGEILFLFRIILTIFILIATAGLVFGFYPGEISRRK